MKQTKLTKLTMSGGGPSDPIKPAQQSKKPVPKKK